MGEAREKKFNDKGTIGAWGARIDIPDIRIRFTLAFLRSESEKFPKLDKTTLCTHFFKAQWAGI